MVRKFAQSTGNVAFFATILDTKILHNTTHTNLYYTILNNFIFSIKVLGFTVPLILILFFQTLLLFLRKILSYISERIIKPYLCSNVIYHSHCFSCSGSILLVFEEVSSVISFLASLRPPRHSFLYSFLLSSQFYFKCGKINI